MHVYISPNVTRKYAKANATYIRDIMHVYVSLNFTPGRNYGVAVTGTCWDVRAA